MFVKNRISVVGKALTSLPCWGRVVIGSLYVYQTVGAGSDPVASPTVLVSAIRSIGNGQKNCSSCAWRGPREIGALSNFLVPRSSEGVYFQSQSGTDLSQ